MVSDAKESIVRKVLQISCDISTKEADLLDDIKNILNITGEEIAGDSFLNLANQKLGLVLYYQIQACWHFLRSIFNLYLDRDYHSAYILGRSSAEYYIEFCFLLKEDSVSRASEYLQAYEEGRDPFKKMTRYSTLEKRSKSVGLGDFYNMNYRSLCRFAHVDMRGSLIARNTEKFISDKPKFLLHMPGLFLEMLDIVSRKTGIRFSERVAALIQEGLRRIEKSPDRGGELTLPNL